MHNDRKRGGYLLVLIGYPISCSSLSSLVIIFEALAQKILAFESHLTMACCRPDFHSKTDIVGIFWER
jgi:hypothetical protein